jgi:hypothetical protein
VGLKLLILLILVRRILRVFSTGVKIGFDVHVERGKSNEVTAMESKWTATGATVE